MNHRADLRRVKIHRSYTIDEIARTTGVHKNTVRHWIEKGLPTVDDRRPALVLGSEVKRFHEASRAARKRPCAPGQMYCFKCREPRSPAFATVDYIPFDEATGNLSGLCPVCGTLMHKRASLSRLEVIAATLEVQFPHGTSRLREIPEPSLNRDFGRDC